VTGFEGTYSFLLNILLFFNNIFSTLPLRAFLLRYKFYFKSHFSLSSEAFLSIQPSRRRKTAHGSTVRQCSLHRSSHHRCGAACSDEHGCSSVAEGTDARERPAPPFLPFNAQVAHCLSVALTGPLLFTELCAVRLYEPFHRVIEAVRVVHSCTIRTALHRRDALTQLIPIRLSCSFLIRLQYIQQTQIHNLL
jgi:hypothetical protein